nr:hypothetical protein BaRGS_019483 [Batillaria attramentaria]
MQGPPSIIYGQNRNFSVTGDRINVSFVIRTHTARTDNCQLSPARLKSGEPADMRKTRDCLRSLSVTGTPPDLVLTVLLDNVSSEDEGRWILNVSNDAGSGFVDFWLTVPKDQNTTVDILCTWDEGNPPVTARLLDRHGAEMKGSIYSSGQIRYRFPAVSCQDAGLIRCAPAFLNPDFNEITLPSGDDAEKEFPFLDKEKR